MRKPIKVKENSPKLWSIPSLLPTDSKYTRGAVAVLGGEEMTGAARLAALAAQRAGAGLVTIAATKASWPLYAASMMSVIARPLDSKGWQALVNDARLRVVLIGPGAGVNARTKAALRAAATSGKPLVLDADALTLIANDALLRKALMKPLKILTPHAGEYVRLAKALKLSPTLEKPALALALAQQLNAVVVLKGSDTIVCDGARLSVTHPPAWLATAGTGDVLAGVITACVAQGMPLFDAANAGVWLHAEAARAHGRGMIAEDIIVSIPKVLRSLK